MTFLSACLIIKNEEHWLDQCLNSLFNVADEIIIVDTGSTDKSMSIAEKYNCKIFYFKWTGNFSEARNFAISKASGEWIISIDADETLVKANDLKAFLKNIPLTVGGVLIERENQFKDLQTEKFLVEIRSNLRIFRKNNTIFWSRPVHEHISFSIRNSALEIISSPFKILHHLTSLTENELFIKQRKYFSILEEDKDHRNELYNAFFKAQTHLILKDPTSAKRILEELLINDPVGNLLFLALNQYVIICLTLNDLTAAKENLNLSIEHFPNQSFGYYLMAQLLFKENNFVEAMNFENKWIISGDKISTRANLEGDMYLAIEQAAEFTGICCIRSGQFEKALEKLSPGLTDNPFASGCYLRAGQVYFMMGNNMESKAHAKKAVELNPDWKEAVEFFNKIWLLN